MRTLSTICTDLACIPYFIHIVFPRGIKKKSEHVEKYFESLEGFNIQHLNCTVCNY